MTNECLVYGVLLGGACLIGSTGATATEPFMRSEMPQDSLEAPETWGDPDEDEESERGWTWFGMGYEQRMRETGAAANNAGGNISGGQSGQRKARRK